MCMFGKMGRGFGRYRIQRCFKVVHRSTLTGRSLKRDSTLTPDRSMLVTAKSCRTLCFDGISAGLSTRGPKSSSFPFCPVRLRIPILLSPPVKYIGSRKAHGTHFPSSVPKKDARRICHVPPSSNSSSPRKYPQLAHAAPSLLHLGQVVSHFLTCFVR